MGLIDVYRINPADAFSVYSPTLKKTQEITYYTLLAKIRGDLNITAVDSNIDNWNEAYDQVVVAGAVTGYETKTITLTRRDGSTISFDFQDLNPESDDTLDMVTTRGNVTLNTIDVGGVKTDYVLFDTAATPTLQVGMMAWNSADGTVDLRLMGNDVTLQLGQEQVVRVVNKSGGNLLEANYQAVKITGAQGNRLKIGLARGDSDPNSADTIGLVTETIANNQEGFVTSSGLVRNINTTGSLQGETWNDGDVLYLSPTTFGAVTNIKPLAPQHTVILGFVIRAHVNQGQIYVKVDNGYELNELHNVRITSVANNDTLLYDSTLSVWKNIPISSVAATLSFSTIAVTGSSTIVADSTSDTLTVTAGTGITLAGNATTDTLTITNDDRGSSQNIFKNIAVAGQTTVVADSNNDTLTLIAGTNVTLTTDATNDTITINSTGGGGGASGTVTYVDVVGGTGISTTGGPVTTTGTITVTNTDKGSDQFIWKNIAVPGEPTIVVDNNDDTLTIAPGTGISLATNNTTDTLTITNSSPDQTVVLTEGANIDITGTYPSFTISSTDQFVGTVTSVNLTPGTGISVLGGPITSNGSITVTNTDTGSAQNIFKTIDVTGQTPVVATTNASVLELQAGTGMTITTSAPGSWVRFNNSDTGSAQNIFKNVAVAGQSTIVADSNDDTLTAAAGTGITLTTNATTDTLTITNSAPDQVVTLSSGTGISVTGAYPSFTVTNTDRGSSQNIFKNVAVAGQNTIVADSNNDTLTMSSGTGITITTNDTTDTLTVTNSAPDQVVSITGAGTSVVTGAYPNFTVTSADQFLGTVTSVSALTIGTTGTDLSSTVANSTTTPVITLQVPTASATNRGALSSVDWITFNSKEPALTKGNLTEATSSVLTITGGTGAVIGSGTTIQVSQSGASTSGFLSSTDWNTFNGKQNAITLTTTGSSGAATLIGATLNIPSYTDQFVGTVTSVGLTPGTGISIAGSTITSSGTFTVTNSDRGSSQNIFKNIAVPTQTTITASSNNDTFTIKPGSGISATTTGNDITLSNTDPGSAQNIFKNVAVAGQSTVVADINNDTLTLVAGTNVSITTDATTDSITINSTGVGTVTSVDLTAGSGISVSGGPITSSGSITVNNTDKGSDQNIFKNVAVSGQSTVVADTNNDTLTLVAGSNIVLTTNATTDSITIDASIPVIATPGDAVYERDYVTPFVVPAAWAMVNLNATDIRVSVNKDLSADNRGYFFVTFEVESTQVGPQFRMFKYKLYNANTTTDVVDSESYWVGYMYGTSEVPYTTFSFHIPSADAGVDTGDVIELHVQELSSGTAPDITYAALSYIDAVG